MNVEQLRGSILVDTNVLIYATLARDPRHAVSQSILELRHRQDVQMYVSVQNLAEMYPNLTGPKNQPADTPELARRKIDSITRLDGLIILPVTRETIIMAIELCAQHLITKQRYFDCQLVAMMQLEMIATIVTENVRDFAGFTGIRAVNPFL
jgi:predicted nucleic acid-binding protein